MRKKPYTISNHAHIAGTLKSLLVTINGLEGSEPNSVPAVELARAALREFIRTTISPNYPSDAKLAQLDRVFKSAGWDDQGLRLDFNLVPMVMHFLNTRKTQWESTE